MREKLLSISKTLSCMACILVLLLLGTSALAHPYIIDFAHVLRNSEKEHLDSLLSDYEKKTTVELVGVTIDSLNGQSIDDYGMKLGNTLGIGKRYVNNGGLIVLAIKDRKVRIELGNGLEWCVSDDQADQIVSAMIPILKTKDYAGALNLGFRILIEMTAQYTWAINEKRLDSLDKTDIGKIFAFEATAAGSDLVEHGGNATYYVSISIVDSAQFQNKVNSGRKIQVMVTKHMDNLIQLMRNNKCSRVTLRLDQMEPMIFKLLNVSVQ